MHLILVYSDSILNFSVTDLIAAIKCFMVQSLSLDTVKVLKLTLVDVIKKNFGVITSLSA
jgi:hypothetical protein